MADGIVQVARALARVDGKGVKGWGLAHDLEGYLGSSVKGEAGIDWDNKNERQACPPEDCGRCRPAIGDGPSCPREVSSRKLPAPEYFGGNGVAGAVAATGCGAPGRWTCPEERGEPGPGPLGPRPSNVPWAQKQEQSLRRPQGCLGGGYRFPIGDRSRHTVRECQ